jgi:hypothetical protein
MRRTDIVVDYTLLAAKRKNYIVDTLEENIDVFGR